MVDKVVAIVILVLCLGQNGLAQENQPVVPDLSRVKILDLKTAQNMALAGNPDIAAARMRIEQARARVRQAVAAWLPSLDAGGSAAQQRLSETQYQQNRGLAALLGGSADRNTDTYTATLQATWVLFDGFARSFREQQAAFDEQSTAAALVNSRRLLVTSVAEAFLNAQLAQTNADIARADEAFYSRQLEDAQNRFKVGAGPWGDVLNIKVQLNSAITSVTRYQREFEAAGYGLAGLMGLPEAEFPTHVRLESLDKEAIALRSGEKPEELIQKALSTRPDIRRLEAQIRQAEAATGVAKAPFYPKLQVGAGLEGAREGNMGLSSDDFGSTVGINMNWNLYAGGADKARLLEAEQARREAVYTLAGLRNAVAAEVRQDLALLASAEEQVRLQRESVSLVEENRNLARKEYEAGESSLVRLNEAQRDLNTTYGRLALALVGYKLAKERLDSAVGRNLLPFDNPDQGK